MQTVIELINAAKPNKCLLKGRVRELVEGVESGKIVSKEDAIQHLYKDSVDPQESLTKLIRRAKRLLAVSVITSVKSKSRIHKVHYEIYAGFAIIMSLLVAGKRQAAMEEARRIYPLARKYEQLNIASELALKLSRFYAESSMQARLKNRFVRDSEHLARLISINTQSNSYFTDVLTTLNNRSSYTKSLINKLEQYTDELKDKLETLEVLTQYFTMEVIKCFAYQDYARAALCCKIVLEELSNKSNATASHKARFLGIRAVAGIAAKQHDMAEESLKEALDLTGHSLVTWQILTYYRAVNAIHSGSYYKAEWLYAESEKRSQVAFVKERWAIVHAYLSILNKRRFRLGKFFNETIEASQDKAGLNVHILVADLLVSLQHNRDRFLHRLEAVRNYSYRHLRGKATERVRFFLEILFLIPRCDFDRDKLEKSSRLIQLKLKRRSIYANHNLEIEVIPFEVLIEVVMEEMEQRRSRKSG